jgi:hypothetical protein
MDEISKLITVLLPVAVILFAFLLLFEYIRIRRDDEMADLREALAAGTRDGHIRRPTFSSGPPMPPMRGGFL